jgi:hypothetical protein
MYCRHLNGNGSSQTLECGSEDNFLGLWKTKIKFGGSIKKGGKGPENFYEKPCAKVGQM